MSSNQDLNAIFDRIANGEETEEDRQTLRDLELRAREGQNSIQIGKYNVNISEGRDIQIGDRIYQGADAEAIAEAIKEAFLNSNQLPHFKGSNSSTQEDLNPQKSPEIKALHNKVKNYWISFLQSSLEYKRDLPNLDIKLEELPNAIKQKPGFDRASYTPQQISSENITELFIEMGEGGRSLLILGEPGSGKTTILLKLLEKLIDNFEFGKDPGKPVPVVFNLSSWTKGQENFTNWLVKELRRIYSVSPRIANQLIKKQQLLLLLDGLDEVKVEGRKDCVQKLNKFIEEHGVTDIVVCSRLREYEEVLGSDCRLLQKDKESSCSEDPKLNLQKAFYLQPITTNQISLYFQLVNQPVEPLQRLLRKFPQLRNPLVIFLIIKAEIDVQSIPERNSFKELFKYLIEEYVELMLIRREESIKITYEKYSGKNQKTKYWLHWLAMKLKEVPSKETRFQGDIFQIEGMQPYWLPSEKDKFVYRIATGLIVGSILGLIAGFYFIYYLELMRQDKSITIAITNTLKLKLITIGLLPGLISVLITARLPISSKRLIRGGVPGITFALFIFLVFNLLEPQLLRIYMPPIYLCGIFGGGCFSLIRAEIQPVETWQPEWQQIVKFSLIFGAFGILYMLARRFIITPEFYKDKPFYVIYDVMALVIVGAVYGGFKIKKDSVDPKQGEPNQGIKRSATYTVISFTICTIIAILCGYIFDPAKNLVLIFLGLSVGLLGGLGANQGSGIVCIQHFILRVILCRQGCIPWNYARFLNYASERVFLGKSGGAYLFIHPKLMDYFAKMEQNSATVLRR
ncbi:putative signal transduction protein with Nacht domain [Tolypothrix sp. NIES-4075]|uniref:NACHT domain-containing protein n=1 Tax=Tolypothrix sp. NIES-4075 TaxID=2005459 RepID=UPI000B5CDB42|nr:NACHT domain-containing protein [Tolypothrix sp. NIES-4075]GAX44445.1 putative signal transduction protein with Nacht domain [Tolypothrix sp. NIES-4075]